MKNIILSIAVALSLTVYAQDDKAVGLVVSGQGKTQDEAKQNALRSAIEQAFGTFISSKTEILNDNLVKDEIVSVANGNIQSFEIISEVQIPNGGYATSLKATVSVSKLTSFVQSKGIAVEFKGSLFAFNVNQQILNEKNEIKAIKDLYAVAMEMSDRAFDFSLKASDPISLDAGNENWKIPLEVSVKANKNLFLLIKHMYSTLKGLSLTRDEALNYSSLGKLTYPISLAADNANFCHVIMRSDTSRLNILKMIYYFNHSLQNFEITNGQNTFSIYYMPPKNLLNIYDAGFRVLIQKNARVFRENELAPYSSSVFYNYPHCGRDKRPEACPGEKPILNYKKWITSEPWVVNEIKAKHDITFNITYNGMFTEQFSFVNALRNLVINNNAGNIISFIGVNSVDDLVIFYIDDKRTLSEINKIQQYKVRPLAN